MRKTPTRLLQKISIFLFLIGIPLQINAQRTDKELISASIETYFDGWMTGDTLKIGKVMHSSCNLKNIKENKVVLIDRKNYLSRFKLHPRPANSFGRIISIDITGNIAAAKCEIEIPERIFTDYFNMMKLNEQWYIVDKISTNTTRPK